MTPLWYWTPAYTTAACLLGLIALVVWLVRAEVTHRRRMRKPR